MRNLYDIIDDGDLDELKEILNNGISPDDCTYEEDMCGATPLFFANAEQTKLLIKAGANIHHVDDNNENALFYLSIVELEKNENIEDKLNILLDHGIDINHRNKDGDNLLFKRSLNYDLKLLKYLEKKGLDIFCLNNLNENILFSMHNQDIEVYEYLIEKGLNINQENFYKKNVLFYTENVDIMKLYLKYGANINKIDEYGCTVLMNTNSHHIMELLIDSGIDIDKVDSDGYNALDNCAFFTNIVEKLLCKNIEIRRPVEFYSSYPSFSLITAKNIEYLKEKTLNEKEKIKENLNITPVLKESREKKRL